jgi:hypothetical protein
LFRKLRVWTPIRVTRAYHRYAEELWRSETRNLARGGASAAQSMLNNRAEHSHQPTRLRERKMRRFKSAKQAQRFLSAFGPISGYFQPRRHRLSASEYHAIVQDRFLEWNEGTGGKQAAYVSFVPHHFLISSFFPPSNSTVLFAPMNNLTISLKKPTGCATRF